jgi:transposase-like protein
MGKGKISILQLEQMVREGNGVSEIARKLGVSKGAVSKRLKDLRVGITKDFVLRSAPQIVDRQLNAMDQLKRINGLINNELNYIEKNIETAIGDQRKELQDQRLRHVAEVRKQLGLLLDIAQALYNAEEVAAFQQSVLEEIGHAAPEVRDKILQRLNERRAIRSTIGFGNPGI